MLQLNIWINILIAIAVVGISAGGIIFTVMCLDGAPKFQIPNFENKDEERAKISPCDYYTSLIHKSWNEVSKYEKQRMAFAGHLILDECGLST